MSSPLRVGTRGSRLALGQTGQIVERLMQTASDVVIETITTRGDTRGDQPITALGSDGIFVRELERALLDGRIDVAVHSLKDMPTAPVNGLVIGCVPARATPFDALVSQAGYTLDRLPIGATVGTSSVRRAVQLVAARPDLVIRPLRGNVDTRLKRLDAGDYDALILAAAGLERLGLGHRVTALLEPPIFLPAVGQGALGLQIRCGDDQTLRGLAPLDDLATHTAVLAERSCLAEMAGGCLVPVAGFARIDADRLRLTVRVLEQEGTQVREMTVEDEIALDDRLSVTAREAAEALGRRVAGRLLAAGAGDMLARMRSLTRSV
jgi:hydroxymethylbilane synthase